MGDPTGARARRTHALLGGCIDAVAGRLEEWSAASAHAVSEAMFEAASTAANSQDQSQLLGASRLLQKNAESFAARVAAELRGGFERSRARSEGRKDDGEENLELIAEEILTETLAISELIMRCEVRFTQPLFALHARFSVLNAGRRFDNENNPIGPARIGHAIRTAAQGLTIEPEDRVKLYRSLADALLEELGDVYEEINDRLIKAGVLPRFKPTAEPRRQDAGQTTPEAPKAPPAEAGLPAAAGSETQAASGPDQQESSGLVADINSLLDRLNPPSSQAPGGPVADSQSLLAAMDQLRPDSRSPVSAEDLKSQLARQLAPSGAVIGHKDARVIDLMSMVHDYAERELPSSEAFREQLRRLRMPLVRVALSDPEVLDNPEHPARRFLETVAQTGELYLDEDNVDSRVMQRIKHAVTSVLERFVSDRDVFDELVGELQHYLDTLRRRAKVIEKRQIAEAEGKAKLDLARRKASSVVEGLVAKHRPPRYPRSLLREAWIDYLALLHVRGGEDGDDWNQAVTAARFVAVALSGETSNEVVIKLAQRADTFLAILGKGLAQVGFMPADIEQVRARLNEAVRWATERGSGETPAPPVLDQPYKPAGARPRMGSRKETAVRVLPLSEAEHAVRLALERSPFGSWFELRQDGRWVRRKLSWHNPVSGHCLLVNNLGQATNLSLDELARRMHKGEARRFKVEDKPMFDRAFGAIRKRLKRLMGGRREVAAESTA